MRIVLKRFDAVFGCRFFSNHSNSFLHDPRYLISLCNRVSTIPSLLQLHALSLTTGNSSNPFLASKLVSLYPPPSSSALFLSLPPSSADTFLWNSIIQSHFSRALFPQSLQFYSLMRKSGVLPDHFTVPMVSSSCAQLMMIEQGKALHGLASKTGLFYCSSAVGCSFVSLY